MDLLTRGNYPFIKSTFVGNHLPRFTKKQSEELGGSFDFIGINYYTSSSMMFHPVTTLLLTGFISTHRESENCCSISRKDTITRLCAELPSLDLYVRISSTITVPLEEALKDDIRITYHHKHLLYLQRAISDGADVRGYFARLLLDNFEWSSSYTVRFGINFVDYKDGLERSQEIGSMASQVLWKLDFQ
ncbi:beta-glucosidase 13-like [Elaeis guineensis]|uniref:beta-glucosidase 13-like n=1 Tax=Elaeis guineensis var. tenera TaxID=51953 RepID=UPI003C6D30BE